MYDWFDWFVFSSSMIKFNLTLLHFQLASSLRTCVFAKLQAMSTERGVGQRHMDRMMRIILTHDKITIRCTDVTKQGRDYVLHLVICYDEIRFVCYISFDLLTLSLFENECPGDLIDTIQKYIRQSILTDDDEIQQTGGLLVNDNIHGVIFAAFSDGEEDWVTTHISVDDEHVREFVDRESNQ